MSSAARLAPLLLIAAAFIPAGASAYPWPFDNGTGPYPIGGTFGEFREGGESPSGISGVHFHTGIDITTQTNANVRAISGGTIKASCITGCGNYPYLRIEGNGFAFTYMHVIPLSGSGSVNAGDIIGSVYTSPGWPTHVHLIYRNMLANVYLNGLEAPFPGPANYVDTSSPTVSSISVYNSSSSVFASPIDLSSPTAYASFRVRANVYDRQSYGSPGTRTGVFSTGYQILRADTGQVVLSFPVRQAYSSIPNAYISNPDYAFDSFNSNDSTYLYFVNNLITNTVPLDFSGLPDANYKICVLAKDIKNNGGDLTRMQGALCQNLALDRTKPTMGLRDANGATIFDGGASSMTTITVTSTDTFGLAQITLTGPTPASRSVTGYTATEVFTGLADGSYTATIVDLAGNTANAAFMVQIEPATASRKEDTGSDYQSPGASTTSFFCSWSSPVGIKKVTFGTSVYNFTCPDNTSVTVGPFANLPAGNHTCSGETCAGVTSSTSISVNAGTYQMELSAYSDGTSTVTNTVNVDSNTIRGNAPVIRVRSACTGTFPASDLACMYIGGTLGSDCFVINDGCQYAYRDIPGNSADVTNSTNTSPPFGLEFRSSLGGYSVSVGGLSYIATGNARVKISQAGQNYPRESPDGKFGGNLGYKGGNIGPTGFLPQWLRDILNKVKRTLDTIVESITGSDLVFTSTGTINFTLTGVTAATDTMRIYQWTTAGWSSGTVTDQTISLSGTGVLRATGTVSTGGYFVLLYDGSDSSAPVTGFNIQGSSFVFDTTLFLSTYSYVVFVATDPAVNGFASGAATSYYRLDPDSTTAYTAYTSSIPVPLGFHTIQYYSVDYAGNAEAPKISSFVVTAGSVFRASEGMRAPGGVLAGFLGSGAQVEVVSAAENDLTVRVSSQNGTPLFTVNNIGGVGVGTDLSLGHVDIQGRGSSGETALLLRSGSAAGGSQVQFGYNGDVSMRHQLKTRHSTAAYGNALDFLVWNPGAGSTTTAADLGALSLEGSTLTVSGALAHVHPAGQADEELVVSDGVTMGGGTIHRLAAYAPSSLRLKSSVRRLGTREEDRAFEETAALRHARFRYKGEPAGAPLRLGLIYEDAPESLRAEGKTVSVDERVANLELALKASMRRLEALQKRLRELEAP